MSAAILREAARLMRERAEAAACTYAEHHPKAGERVPWFDMSDAYDFDEADGLHIIGMSPTVAIDVADVLDLAAQWVEDHPGSWPPANKAALAVATTYLGGAR